MYTSPAFMGGRSELSRAVLVPEKSMPRWLRSMKPTIGSPISSTARTLILTTTVTRGGQYLARKTDVYYLENADTPLFTRPSYKNVNMKVVSQ